MQRFTTTSPPQNSVLFYLSIYLSIFLITYYYHVAHSSYALPKNNHSFGKITSTLL